MTDLSAGLQVYASFTFPSAVPVAGVKLKISD